MFSLERLAIGGQKLAVTVGLRRGDAAKLFARHILYGGRRVILIDHEDLLVVWKRGYGIAIPFAHLDHVGEYVGVDQRSDAVMDDDDVFWIEFMLQMFHTVADGFLHAAAAGHDPLELVDVELLGIGVDHGLPTVDAHHRDGVDVGVALEALQRVDEHGLVEHVDELLRNILPHSGSGTARYHYRYILHGVHSIPLGGPC